MKKVFFIITFFACLSGASAQTITKDANGNYIAIQKQKDTASNGAPTGKTFTDSKGKVWPLLVSKNGKLFYRRTSAAGNVYNSYLKIN